MSALARAAATVDGIDMAVRVLTDLEAKLSDVAAFAYLDGREDGARENPPPPGIAANVQRDRISALLTAPIATLRSFQ